MWRLVRLERARAGDGDDRRFVGTREGAQDNRAGFAFQLGHTADACAVPFGNVNSGAGR